MKDCLNRSMSNPCPICGKPDWCTYKPPSADGAYYVYCMRHLKGDDVYGKDGQNYVFCGMTDSGNARYMEENMYNMRKAAREARKKWKETECSRLEPCLICGDTEGRCHRLLNQESGDLYHLCSRVRTHQNVNRGGFWYVYEKETKDGTFSRYEESNSRSNRIRKWKNGETGAAENQRTFHEVQETAGKQQKQQQDEIQPRENRYLDKIYRFILDNLVLDPVHRAYLLQEGWTDEMMEKNNIKSFPENDYFREKYNNNPTLNPSRKELARKVIDRFGKDALLGVPGAYKDKLGNWTFYGAKGILFPLPDVDGNIYRLRIRMDFMDVDAKVQFLPQGVSYYEKEGKKIYIHPLKGYYTQEDGHRVYLKTGNGKYRNFASGGRDCGCAAGNQIGVYRSADNAMFILFVTEGEKKGIFSNDKLDAPFVSLPGVNSWSKLLEGEKGSRPIDKLILLGVKMIVIAFDADVAENNAVLKQQINVFKAIKEEGLEVGVASWDVTLGKGIDDLLAGGNQPYYDIVDDAFIEECEKEYLERANNEKS